MPTSATRRSVILFLAVLAMLLPLNDSFLVGPSVIVLSPPPTSPFSSSSATERSQNDRMSTSILRITPFEGVDTTTGYDAVNGGKHRRLALLYNIAKLATSVTWIITAYVALSYHPDPRFKDCTLRHNLLTMSQAYAFPLPVLWASFDVLRRSAMANSLGFSSTAQRLGVAVSVASFWLTASIAVPARFAFGYDLYRPSHKVIATLVHAATGLFTMGIVLRTTTPERLFRGWMDSLWKLGPKKNPQSDTFERNSSLFATGCVGLLWFTVLPIVSQYPLATIPTILGKRLSRPASAFTFLGSVMAFCLKEGGERDCRKTKRILSRGLAMGSGSHIFLIALKLIGVDGGGWIFPGRGLWEVYPAMMAVPFAAGLSMMVHAIVCYATYSFP